MGRAEALPFEALSYIVSQSTHECRASLLTSADCLLALQHPPLSALTRTIIQRSRLSYVFEPLHFRLSRVVCSYSWPCASSFAGSVLLHTGDLISGTPKSRCCKRSPFPPTARTGRTTHSERNGHLPKSSFSDGPSRIPTDPPPSGPSSAPVSFTPKQINNSSPSV
jgi:hypothetical protein